MGYLPMQTLQLSSGTIHYRVMGEGPPLLLLHGWASSSRYWQGTLEDLADIRTVYAPDLPGYGASPPLNKPATPENLTDLLAEFVDALGFDQFDLNAHSLSSVMAVHLDIRWPERVRRLVLTCSGTYRDERNRRTVERVHRFVEMWLALRRPWMESMRPLYRTVARRFFYRLPDNDGLLRESFADFLGMDLQTALETSLNAVSPHYNDLLQKVTAPTMVVGARQDRLMPQYGPPIMQLLIPRAHLVWIERCGHLPMIERPAIYHRLLRLFLTANGSQDQDQDHGKNHTLWLPFLD